MVTTLKKVVLPNYREEAAAVAKDGVNRNNDGDQDFAAAGPRKTIVTTLKAKEGWPNRQDKFCFLFSVDRLVLFLLDSFIMRFSRCDKITCKYRIQSKYFQF
ncbi:hypothetical protein KC19_5G090600 [Ceratodon purpureus]|uniref:Uncharacterized protein n=1 Tax=Ceratodon purpureus TaxID=3225 RepID=A0A8T0I0Z9_CERPU|nr:hypothetical protein KC19_5G090600 [Ceratodon purpureus]